MFSLDFFKDDSRIRIMLIACLMSLLKNKSMSLIMFFHQIYLQQNTVNSDSQGRQKIYPSYPGWIKGRQRSKGENKSV